MWVLGRKKLKFGKNEIKDTPVAAGVYIFWNAFEIPVYVGKSTNLRARLASYLSSRLLPKTAQMVNEARSFSYVRTTSELEALLLEAKLVKSFNPKFNTQLKDDKHPLYIRISKDEYPQILTARRIDKEKGDIAFFGPFPVSNNVKDVLKTLRRIIPYAQHKVAKRACLYSQIGLCNPCPSIIEKESDKAKKMKMKKKYLENITLIKKILSGEILGVRTKLVKTMEKLAADEKFEEAAVLRNQIAKLDYVTQPITPITEFLKNPNLIEDIRKAEKTSLVELLKPYFKLTKLRRVECFDVAHLRGEKATASMVTFIHGEPEKKFYRHFKIVQKKGQDDIASLSEVAKRRIKHFSDWGLPDLVVVDGGKGQVSIFSQEIAKYKIPTVGLAKRFETLVIPQKSNNKKSFVQIRLKGPSLYFLQRLRDEAHRFARRYHHKLIQKEFSHI